MVQKQGYFVHCEVRSTRSKTNRKRKRDRKKMKISMNYDRDEDGTTKNDDSLPQSLSMHFGPELSVEVDDVKRIFSYDGIALSYCVTKA
jgi:hypothetical protein